MGKDSRILSHARLLCPTPLLILASLDVGTRDHMLLYGFHCSSPACYMHCCSMLCLRSTLPFFMNPPYHRSDTDHHLSKAHDFNGESVMKQTSGRWCKTQTDDTIQVIPHLRDHAPDESAPILAVKRSCLSPSCTGRDVIHFYDILRYLPRLPRLLATYRSQSA